MLDVCTVLKKGKKNSPCGCGSNSKIYQSNVLPTPTSISLMLTIFTRGFPRPLLADRTHVWIHGPTSKL